MMSYWVLPQSGIPVSVTTVQRLTNDERNTDETKSQMNQFDDKLKVLFETHTADVTQSLRDVHTSKVIDPDNEDPAFLAEFTRIIDDATLPHADEIANVEVVSDNYVGMELALTRGGEGEMVHATVRRRLNDKEGRPIGRVHTNPLLDSRMYEIEYADGHIDELTANVIAENLIAQVDEEGRRQMMLGEIMDHRVLQDAIPKSEGTYVNPYGIKRQKMTTRGWELLVEWKDGSSDWVALKDLKESYPVELALYAVNREIQDEPVFAWWVPYVLKKQKRILQKIKSKYWARTHKYGIRIPKNIREAIEIDKENGNTLCDNNCICRRLPRGK
jgi:hypothetical protein